MAVAVVMPKAGITVEQCIIGKWQKNVGDTINEGDILFTYETDKASFECESTASGVLLAKFFEDGDEVPCLINVCAIGAAGEDFSALKPEQAQEEAAPAAPQAPVEEKATVPAAEEKPAVTAQDGKAPVSPRARTLAQRAGVDAALATPTGPYGRIIERDVRRLMKEGVPANAAQSAPADVKAPAQAPETEYEDVKFTGIRRAISKSMMASLSSMAQLTHHHSFDASAIMGYRKLCKASEGDFAGITLGDMVLYAVSRTILNHPDLNANMIKDGEIRRFKHVNLGVAVDTPRGLMVPTIFHADEKSLVEISREVKDLAAQARSGSISPDLLTGASFTVSNLGNFGVESFTPVINPPQTGILGVCTITQRVRAGKDGQIAMYPAMGISLTYDHRAVDGGPASRFMSELSKNLEQFTLLLAK